MTIYDWPATLAPQGSGFNRRGMTVGGPNSLTGRTQVGSIDAGYWIASLTGFRTDRKERVKAYRAVLALLEGGAHQIRVPVFDCRQAPWPLDSNGKPVTSAGDVQFSDGSVLDDGTSLWQPVIVAETVGATALRSTRITIDMVRSADLAGGEYFSLGDRLYLVRQVLSATGTQKTLGIWPPLREAVPDGTPANFDRPSCVMRLTDEAQGDLSLDYGRYGFPDLSFVEVF